MARACNENLRKALELTDRMIRVADGAFAEETCDEERRILCLIREMAVKLRGRVEDECARHRAAGGWD